MTTKDLLLSEKFYIATILEQICNNNSNEVSKDLVITNTKQRDAAKKFVELFGKEWEGLNTPIEY
jgi:hypothetical protein